MTTFTISIDDLTVVDSDNPVEAIEQARLAFIEKLQNYECELIITEEHNDE